jgi:hypothetical protein
VRVHALVAQVREGALGDVGGRPGDAGEEVRPRALGADEPIAPVEGRAQDGALEEERAEGVVEEVGGERGRVRADGADRAGAALELGLEDRAEPGAEIAGGLRRDVRARAAGDLEEERIVDVGIAAEEEAAVGIDPGAARVPIGQALELVF